MPIDLRSLLIRDLSLPRACFSNDVIVVTGAGGGIGLQIARAFALLGGKVVIAELAESGQEAEALIRSEGGEATFIQTDVADDTAIRRLAQVARDRYGLVTILVNNAIYIREATAVDLPVRDWDRTVAINLRGTFLTCQSFLPAMLEHRRGTIINMVSTDAMPGLSAYIASKQGIVGFSQSLDLEVSSAGVKVIPFAPGMVDTPGIRSVAEGLAPRLGLQKEQFLSLSLHSGYSGLMPAEHAAAAVVYLALNLADELHGQVVNGYDVLEKAGVLKRPETPSIGTPAPTSPSPADQRELIQKLAKIVDETDAEFNRLPVFVRPIARQGFKGKSGRSLPDWQRLLAAIVSGESPIPAQFTIQLEKLSGYYRDTPKETARFTRDPEMLRQVAEISAERLEVIESLIETNGH